MIPIEKWQWFGVAGHYCGADKCLFRMSTRVGKYLVSTVGEYYPDGNYREGPLEIGRNRLYETMVFKFSGVCKRPDCGCGLPHIVPNELEMLPANTRGVAQENHMGLCHKYAEMQ